MEKLTDIEKQASPEKVKCPGCGAKLRRQNALVKEWIATPKAKIGQILVTIHMWKCPCGHRWRTATRTLKQ